MISLASQQCQPISNDSILPLVPSYYTDKRLNDINFNHDKILRVIRSLNPNKAHGHDGPSIRMLKLSCPSVIKTLLIIFPNCLKFGFFKDGWKNSKNKFSIIIALYTSYLLHVPKFLKSSFLILFLNL